MRVLLIGSGGREHALAWALSASPLLTKLFAAPGNAGICERRRMRRARPKITLPSSPSAGREKIDLVVVGPEAPLVAGLVDDLEAAGIRAFGPSKAAAQLEGSKGFTKDLCREAGIPTAGYAPLRRRGTRRATMSDATQAPDRREGRRARRRQGRDGRDGPRGARRSARRCDLRASPAPRVVIEEFLEGEEASFFALSRRQDRHPVRHGAGPQARLRRRSRPEHRRHGRLFARARS